MRQGITDKLQIFISSVCEKGGNRDCGGGEDFLGFTGFEIAPQ